MKLRLQSEVEALVDNLVQRTSLSVVVHRVVFVQMNALKRIIRYEIASSLLTDASNQP
ncbi:hypothetical protein [Fluviicola sp.]|uniref:hypothetical protein n=1 Tax=Fluviicola sp. TaxID=1917219 RepID=UPI0031E10619